MDNAVGVQLQKAMLALAVITRPSKPPLELLTCKADYLLFTSLEDVGG
jgi:hypothetical protein